MYGSSFWETAATQNCGHTQGISLTSLIETKINKSCCSILLVFLLKEWIDLNTNFRKVAKNDFEKDYFK